MNVVMPWPGPCMSEDPHEEPSTPVSYSGHVSHLSSNIKRKKNLIFCKGINTHTVDASKL